MCRSTLTEQPSVADKAKMDSEVRRRTMLVQCTCTYDNTVVYVEPVYSDHLWAKLIWSL